MLALQETELSPRELAVTFTDKDRHFVSGSTVYRTLKAHGQSGQVGRVRCETCGAQNHQRRPLAETVKTLAPVVNIRTRLKG